MRPILSSLSIACSFFFLSLDLQAQEAGPPPVKDFSGLFITMVLALLAVIAFAFVLIKWLLPRLLTPKNLRRGSRLKVLERYGLEPRKALYLVELQGRRLLLGASEQNLNLLAELKSNPEEEEA
ncbi:MAG: flagellar biosynthetic protein FliO [Deltaproteobacteria bacterium]|nr:flagellar biosynthetic protein FliO [Deltaproteobacteria bacterium]